MLLSFLYDPSFVKHAQRKNLSHYIKKVVQRAGQVHDTAVNLVDICDNFGIYFNSATVIMLILNDRVVGSNIR